VLARRARRAILAGTLGAAALAWLAIVRMERTMWGMPMGGLHPWSALDFSTVLAMWTVMMVGMMLPSALPATFLYARVAQRAAREGNALAPTSLFVAGYLLAWSAFSLGATALQALLERAALLSPMWVLTSPRLGGAVAAAAGLYQLTPWKDSCLRGCRAPAQFFAAHWRTGRSGALALGARHGALCVGCCAPLMALLFVGGVMNLIWIAAISLFVLLEKALPFGKTVRFASAGGLFALGAAGMLQGA
jgi:predicted metal-binding membrane protein